jgi:hypothetical protein
MDTLILVAAVLVFFVVLPFVLLRVVTKMSSWQRLAELFPSGGKLHGGTIYRGCAGRVGRVRFSGQGRGLTCRIADEGLGLRGLPLRPELLIPWDRLASIQEISLGRRRELFVCVEAPVRLELGMPSEALPLLKIRVADEAFRAPRTMESLDDIIEMEKERRR